jgi:hypothetical protein
MELWATGKAACIAPAYTHDSKNTAQILVLVSPLSCLLKYEPRGDGKTGSVELGDDAIKFWALLVWCFWIDTILCLCFAFVKTKINKHGVSPSAKE